MGMAGGFDLGAAYDAAPAASSGGGYSAPAQEQTPAQIAQTLDFWQSGYNADLSPTAQTIAASGTPFGQAESASASTPASNTGAFSELPSYTQQTGRDVPTNTSISNQSQPTTIPYYVERGDTLSEIADNAGISLQELKDLNPKFESDPKYNGGNTIFSGTRVNLPNPSAPSGGSNDSAASGNLPVYDTTGPFNEQGGVGTGPYGPSSTPEPPPPPQQPAATGGTSDPQPTFTNTYVEPTPPAPTVEPVLVSPPPPQIKTAQPDIILFDDEQIPAEIMTNLVLENIGGQELISIARHDTINGQKVIYQPIKDLQSIQQKNNPNNVINLQQTEKQYFSGFPIDLSTKLPEEGSGFNGNNLYISFVGDLILEFINLKEDERIEVQVIQNDILYSIDSEE